jgi:hypothetical protein
MGGAAADATGGCSGVFEEVLKLMKNEEKKHSFGKSGVVFLLLFVCATEKTKRFLSSLRKHRCFEYWNVRIIKRWPKT